MKKKIISLIMVCTLMLTSVPTTVRASEKTIDEVDKDIVIEENFENELNQGTLSEDIEKENTQEIFEEIENKEQVKKAVTQKANIKVEENGVLINTKNFDDKYFREYVKNFDENRDGKLSTKERSNVKYINLNGELLYNLHGIGWFKNLEILNIAECRNIKSYNGSKNPNLRELRCWEATNLATIGISKNLNLEKLDISYSAIKQLDLTQNTKLTNLNCAGCNMTTLNVTKNIKLENLDVGDNQLKTLNLKNNPNLINISCWNNPTLKSIDISACEKLQSLDCGECVNLESLDVKKCVDLKKLECWSNYKLKNLNLTKNLNLEYLDCSYNDLKDLNVSKNKNLIDLNCEQCSLTALDLSANTKLKNIKADGNLLTVNLPIVLFENLSTDFDPDKVSDITGGIMEKINGTYKNFKFINSETITYNYEIKDGLTEKFTIKTTFNVPHEKPADVTRLAIYPDYGMIKAICSVNTQEGATYRFACRESGTKKWKYYNGSSNEIIIKNLKKNVLYDIAVANVLGDNRSEYKQKRIYTNRVGNYLDPMKKNQIDKLTTTKGKISVTSKKITYVTNPKIVKYRFAYKVKGEDKWTFIKTPKNYTTISKLKSGITYTVAVGHYYVSPLDNKTIVYSSLSKYKNIKVK